MNRFRKWIALAITLVMFTTVMPMSTFADEVEDTIPAAEDTINLPSAFLSDSEPATGAGLVDIDFSENSMLAAAYHTSSPYKYYGGPDSGGIPDMATAYYARWGGPVLESDDPYPNPPSASYVQYRSGKPLAAIVTDALIVPNSTGTASANISRIKELVYNYGAVYISMQYDDANYMNWSTRAFYMPPNAVQSNSYGHAVTVVGWDDNYSKSNFKAGKQPSSNGAFIIKNSHGTGDVLGDGYFYLSYEDKCVGRLYKITQQENFNYTSDNVVYITKDASLYDNNYGYDPYGYTNAYGFTIPQTVYMANVFEAKSNETLKAVSFYTNEYNVSYEVYIKTASTVSGTLPTASNLTASMRKASGTQAYPGYHTVSLNTPIALKRGEKFSVILKIPGNVKYPFCVEEYTGREANIAFNAGESFLSVGDEFYDINTTLTWDNNFCIRAFTTNGIASGSVPLEDAAGVAQQEPNSVEEKSSDDTNKEQDAPDIDSATAPELEQKPDETQEDSSDVTADNQNDPDASNSSDIPDEDTSSDDEQDKQTNTDNVNEPAIGTQPQFERVSYLDTIDLSDDDEPPAGSADSDESGFVAGAKLQRYSLYFDRGSEVPTAGVLPAKYDLRDTGIITSVKDQGYIGSCWTFAATASAESTYIKYITPLFELKVTRSANYLRKGSSIMFEASTTPQSLVQSYSWYNSGSGLTYSKQGDKNFQYTLTAPSTTLDDIITVSCVATLKNGITMQKDVTLAITSLDGNGSTNNPYLIDSPTKLRMLGGFLGDEFDNVHFKQSKNIDLSSVTWTPIGWYKADDENNPFMGSYDGGGNVLANLKIADFNAESPQNLGVAYGLFGYIKNAQIKNVAFDDYQESHARLTASDNQEYWYGTIAGYAEYSDLLDCSVSASITPNTSQMKVVAGGIIGKMKGGTITHCAVTNSFFNTDDCSEATLGGLSGRTNGVTITKSYSDIYYGNTSSNSTVYMGGLIGKAENGTKVTDSFAIGYIRERLDSHKKAGFAFIPDTDKGAKSIFTRCYSAIRFNRNGSGIAAFIGEKTANATLQQCYYNKDIVSPVTNGSISGLKGLTNADFAKPASFAGFDFTNNWTMIQNNMHDWADFSSFPALRNPLGTITQLDVQIGSDVIYSGETRMPILSYEPFYAWIQQISVTAQNPEVVITEENNGLIKGGVCGKTTVRFSVNGKTMYSSNFTVLTRPADFNFTGTPDYPRAISKLLDLLTGRIELEKPEDFYLLNADRTYTNILKFDSTTREDITLTDLVLFKQAAVGARSNLDPQHY